MKNLRLCILGMLLKKEVNDLAAVYATLIVKGTKTLDQVPTLIKKQVEEILQTLEIEV